MLCPLALQMKDDPIEIEKRPFVRFQIAVGINSHTDKHMRSTN